MTAGSSSTGTSPGWTGTTTTAGLRGPAAAVSVLGLARDERTDLADLWRRCRPSSGTPPRCARAGASATSLPTSSATTGSVPPDWRGASPAVGSRSSASTRSVWSSSGTATRRSSSHCSTHAIPSGLPAGLCGRIALVDGLVHTQDLRRPLGLPRVVPAGRLRAALPFALVAPPIRALWHVRGVRVVATDVDWAGGAGPEARGPGEAVLMVMGGRRRVACELTGPGRPAGPPTGLTPAGWSATR